VTDPRSRGAPRAGSAFRLALAGVLLASCAARLERVGPVRPYVEVDLPASREAVLATLHQLFPDPLAPGPAARGVPVHLRGFALYPRAAPPGASLFPSDADLVRNSRRDPAVARYVSLPAEERRADLLLRHGLDVFWPSEYRARGKTVAFTCDFVLHLGAEGSGRIRVEVLEYLPRVRLGERLALAAHGPGIGWVYDERLVPPTTIDREELLAAIRRALPASRSGQGG
jgi:hypothetical protein